MTKDDTVTRSVQSWNNCVVIVCIFWVDDFGISFLGS